MSELGTTNSLPPANFKIVDSPKNSSPLEENPKKSSLHSLRSEEKFHEFESETVDLLDSQVEKSVVNIKSHSQKEDVKKQLLQQLEQDEINLAYMNNLDVEEDQLENDEEDLEVFNITNTHLRLKDEITDDLLLQIDDTLERQSVSSILLLEADLSQNREFDGILEDQYKNKIQQNIHSQPINSDLFLELFHGNEAEFQQEKQLQNDPQSQIKNVNSDILQYQQIRERDSDQDFQEDELEDYGDEFIDMGDDIQPFSMNYQIQQNNSDKQEGLKDQKALLKKQKRIYDDNQIQQEYPQDNFQDQNEEDQLYSDDFEDEISEERDDFEDDLQGKFNNQQNSDDRSEILLGTNFLKNETNPLYQEKFLSSGPLLVKQIMNDQEKIKPVITDELHEFNDLFGIPSTQQQQDNLILSDEEQIIDKQEQVQKQLLSNNDHQTSNKQLNSRTSSEADCNQEQEERLLENGYEDYMMNERQDDSDQDNLNSDQEEQSNQGRLLDDHEELYQIQHTIGTDDKEQDDFFDPYANSMMFKSFKIPKNFNNLQEMIIKPSQNKIEPSLKAEAYNQDQDFQILEKQDLQGNDDDDLNDFDNDNNDRFDSNRDIGQDNETILADQEDTSKINIFLNQYAHMQMSKNNKQSAKKNQKLNLNYQEFSNDEQILEQDQDRLRMQNLDDNKFKFQQNSNQKQSRDDIDENREYQQNYIDQEESINLNSDDKHINLLKMTSFEQRLNDQNNQFDDNLYGSLIETENMQEDDFLQQAINEEKNNKLQVKDLENCKVNDQNNQVSSLRPQVNLLSFDNEVEINIVDDNSDEDSYDDERFEIYQQQDIDEASQIKNNYSQKIDKQSPDYRQIQNNLNSKNNKEERDEYEDDDNEENQNYRERGNRKNMKNKPEFQEENLVELQDSNQDETEQMINLNQEENDQHKDDSFNESRDSSLVDEQEDQQDIVYDQQMFSRFSSTFKFNPGQFSNIQAKSNDSLNENTYTIQDPLINRNQITYGSENPFQDVNKFDFNEFQPIQDDTFEDFEFSNDQQENNLTHNDDDQSNFMPYQIRKSPIKEKQKENNDFDISFMNKNKNNQPKDSMIQSVIIQNLSLVKGGKEQEIDLRKGVSVEKYFDTQKQIEVRQHKENNFDTQEPEMLKDTKVEILKQTKHEKFYSDPSNKSTDEFDEDIDDEDVQRLKNQSRFRLGKPVDNKTRDKNYNDQIDDDDDDDELDRDEQETRDKDLDELFGFESSAKKQQQIEEQKRLENLDGRTKVEFNTIQSKDWFTAVKYEGWKIIDGARPSSESTEKSKEDKINHTIGKHILSKRLNLIMENIFANIMKNKGQQMPTQPQGKRSKQIKSKFYHNRIKIPFGREILNESLVLNVAQTNIQDIDKITGGDLYLRNQEMILITRSFFITKKKSIKVPIIQNRLYDLTDFSLDCSQEDYFEQQKLEFTLLCNFTSTDDLSIDYNSICLQSIDNDQIQEFNNSIQRTQYIRKQSLNYNDYFLQKVIEVIVPNNELQTIQNQQSPDNKVKIQELKLNSEESTKSTYNEHMPFEISNDQTIMLTPQSTFAQNANDKSITSQSSQQNLIISSLQTNNSNKKLRISRKSIQFINSLAKDAKEKKAPKNQDELPQRSVSLIAPSFFSKPAPNTSISSLIQKQLTLGQPRDLSKEQDLSQKLGSSILKKFPSNMIKIKLASGTKSKPLIFEQVLKQRKEEQLKENQDAKGSSNIVLKSISKSIQNRISDIHQIDPKLLKIRNNILAMNNSKSPSTQNLNSQHSLAIGQDPQGNQNFQDVKKLIMSKTRQKVDLYKSAITADTQTKTKEMIGSSENLKKLQSKFSLIKPLNKVTILNRVSDLTSYNKKTLLIDDFNTSRDESQNHPHHEAENNQRISQVTIRPQSQISSNNQFMGFDPMRERSPQIQFQRYKTEQQQSTNLEKSRNKIESSESLDEIKLPEDQFLSFGSNNSSNHSHLREFKNTILSGNGAGSNLHKEGIFGQMSPTSANRPVKIIGNEFQKEEIYKQLKDKTPAKPHLVNNFLN